MPTRKVYRVENKEGDGPYNSTGYVEELHEMAIEHRNDAHPNPWRDEMLQSISSEERCGFSSVWDVRRWFEGFTIRLAENGYHVSIYDVPYEDIRHGESQVLFTRRGLKPTTIIEFEREK